MPATKEILLEKLDVLKRKLDDEIESGNDPQSLRSEINRVQNEINRLNEALDSKESILKG